MGKGFYVFIRDLHLYFGLFISPFVLVFAVSVFFLAHDWVPGLPGSISTPRVFRDVPIDPRVAHLSNMERIDALRPTLARIGVTGEVTSIRYVPKENRLVIPVTVPGRQETVDLNLETHVASITQRRTGAWDALITLHKSPGPHLGNIRMNWFYMRIWSWLADATVYLLLFISLSGVYLWTALRAERRIGLALLGAGAGTFFALVYGIYR